MTADVGALARLDQAGAHFVLTAADKRPLWRRWNRYRPALAVAAAYAESDGLIGLIPWSIQETAFDVDGEPDPGDRLPSDPRVIVPSRSGAHAYYDDTEPRRNARVELPNGLSGDVRGARGFLVLHPPDGALRLARALDRPGLFKWPMDLFEAAGLPAARRAKPGRRAREVLSAVEPGQRRRPAVQPDLEAVRPGARNLNLFNFVRLWAYCEPWGDLTSPEWLAHVARYAKRANRRFALPLPDGEVHDTAHSIATWIASGGVSWERTEAHERARRQRGGLIRARQQRAVVRGRDRVIVAMLDDGQTQRAVAAAVGVARWTVQTARRRLAVADVEHVACRPGGPAPPLALPFGEA